VPACSSLLQLDAPSHVRIEAALAGKGKGKGMAQGRDKAREKGRVDAGLGEIVD